MNNSTFHPIHSRVAALAARIGVHPGAVYAGLGIAAMLAIAAVIGVFAPAPAPQSPPITATATPPAHTAPITAIPASVITSAVAATTPVATAAAPPDPVLPGIAPPHGLRRMHAMHTLSAAPEPARGGKVAAAEWSQIGSTVADARTAQYSALATPLADMLPSDGVARETWQWWAHVPDGQGGGWLLVLRADGPHDGVARASVDGRAALMAETHARESTAVATLRLGTGWHSITVSYEQPILRARGGMAAAVEVYWRGPSMPAPVAIEPHAVVTGAAAPGDPIPIAPPSSASSVAVPATTASPSTAEMSR